jgi:hypothetical protein
LQGRRRRSARLTVLAVVVVGSLAPAAAASELISRTTGAAGLKVSGGTALVSYRVGRRTHYARAWGAINAIPPTRGRVQVSFRLRRSVHRPPFHGKCRPIRPAIPRLVVACRGSDGSVWALQRWQRSLPNYGLRPTSFQALPDLRLSHWRGDPAVLTLKADWSYGGRFEHVYGTLTYRGHPVYGFKASRTGNPDSFGRNIYLDTLNSGYGRGWKRAISFLTRRPAGQFCYDLVPNHGRTSHGTEYRALVVGPGVSPDVGAFVHSPGHYDHARDAEANAEQRRLAPTDRHCLPH